MIGEKVAIIAATLFPCPIGERVRVRGDCLKLELKEMTGAFVVKFIRRPASEGQGGGIN